MRPVSGDHPILIQGPDGRRVQLETTTLQRLAQQLGDSRWRRHLRQHGLQETKAPGVVCVDVASLSDALAKLHDSPESALRPLRLDGGHPQEQAAALANELGGFDPGTQLIIPTSSHLELVETPANAQDTLGQMNSVSMENATRMLKSLDELLDQVSLPQEVLERTLVPLLKIEQTQALAARLLGRAKVKSAIAAVQKVLAHTQLIEHRIEFLVCLIRLGDRSQALQALRSIAANSDTYARRLVIGALDAVAKPEDANLIHDALRLFTPSERPIVAAILYRLGDPRGYRPILEGIEQFNTLPSEDAIALLRAIEDTNTTRFSVALEQLAEREERPWFAAQAKTVANKLRVNGQPESPVEMLLEVAEEAYYAAETKEARLLLQELLALDPEHKRGLYLYANTLKEDGKLADALTTINRALKIDANNWRAHRLHGSLLWDLSQHNMALSAYEKAIALNPVDPYSWYYKGYVLYRLKRDNEALPCLERALSLKGDSPYIHNQLAFCLERLGRHEDAIGCYKRSLQLKPSDLVIRDYYGQALQASGRRSEALATFRAILAEQPERAETRYHLADVLYDLEQWEEAAAAFERYLVHQPDNYNAWFNRGLCLRFMERYADAIRCFQEAVKKRPDNPNARKHLNYCLTQAARPQRNSTKD